MGSEDESHSEKVRKEIFDSTSDQIAQVSAGAASGIGTGCSTPTRNTYFSGIA